MQRRVVNIKCKKTFFVTENILDTPYLFCLVNSTLANDTEQMFACLMNFTVPLQVQMAGVTGQLRAERESKLLLGEITNLLIPSNTTSFFKKNCHINTEKEYTSKAVY